MGRLFFKKTEWGELSECWFADMTRTRSIQFIGNNTPVVRTSSLRQAEDLVIGKSCVREDSFVDVNRPSILCGPTGVERGMDD